MFQGQMMGGDSGPMGVTDPRDQQRMMLAQLLMQNQMPMKPKRPPPTVGVRGYQEEPFNPLDNGG
jgi:hypothetical protein